MDKENGITIVITTRNHSMMMILIKNLEVMSGALYFPKAYQLENSQPVEIN